MCGPDGERDKIPHPPKVPSGSHQCYSHLCFWAIFYITIYFSRFIFTFWLISCGTPFTLFAFIYLLPPSFYTLIVIFIFQFLFSLFDSFYVVPPLVYSLLFTYYPLHLWVYFMGLFYVKYNFIFHFQICEKIIFVFNFQFYFIFILKYIIFLLFSNILFTIDVIIHAPFLLHT